MIKEKYSRKEIYDMTTKQLLDLSSKIAGIQKQINAELILRGDY